MFLRARGAVPTPQIRDNSSRAEGIPPLITGAGSTFSLSLTCSCLVATKTQRRAAQARGHEKRKTSGRRLEKNDSNGVKGFSTVETFPMWERISQT